jgi:transcriptional antiterminator RfaH
MPVLKAETDLSPPELLDPGMCVEQPEIAQNWWAVHTKSRQEKALARQLKGLRVPFYLPLVPQTTFIGSRRVTSLLPLFPSYMFVFGGDQERLATLSTRRVTQMLCASDTPVMTSSLASIRALIAAGIPLTVESRLEPGERVRVKHGSLMGMEGTILSRRGGDRLLVSVDFLQQGVSIEINDFQVEPV